MKNLKIKTNFKVQFVVLFSCLVNTKEFVFFVGYSHIIMLLSGSVVFHSNQNDHSSTY